MTTTFRVLLMAALLAYANPALALNIVLTNDDGLTSNLKALYDALKAAGHDVIVSVPCTGQSGRGAAIVMYSTTVIVSDNDAQIDAEGGCHNGAAPAGAPIVARGLHRIVLSVGAQSSRAASVGRCRLFDC